MENFFSLMVEALPKLRTRIAYGFMLLVVLAYVFIHTGSDTPVIPQIFIFSVIPLLIAMVLIGKHLPAVHQTILIMTITLMSMAFLGTGVVLAKFDKTPEKEALYENQIYPIENKLDRKYLIPLDSKMTNVKTYSDYRSLVLGEATNDDSEELGSGFDKIVNHYEDFISCERKLECSGSAQYDYRIRDFWYTFRPIIEERRATFWGKEYAQKLQYYAESLQAPLYLSAVRRDPSSGKTTLINTDLQHSWREMLTIVLQNWMEQLRLNSARYFHARPQQV